LCGKASIAEAQQIKSILYDFCNQSGQTPNLQKSSIYFSKNVPATIRNNIKVIFPIQDLQPNTMHLGHPMIFSHKDKNRAYTFIYNKFFAKFGTIKANKLNHAGRLQYIKSVLASIPIYYMSTVLFSKNFIERINTIVKRFWWTGVQEEQDSSPIAYRFWEDICRSKEEGGPSSFTRLGMLLLLKILFYQLFSNPNIILITPFGQPLTIQQNLYIGLLFCRYDITSTQMLPIRSMRAIHPFGHPLGAQSGKTSIITSCFL
jgi:hypothetical protein